MQQKSNKLLSSLMFRSKDCAQSVFTTEAIQTRFIEAHVTCHPQHQMFRKLNHQRYIKYCATYASRNRVCIRLIYRSRVRSGQPETTDTTATVTAVLFQRDTTPQLIYIDSAILFMARPLLRCDVRDFSFNPAQRSHQSLLRSVIHSVRVQI